MAISSTATTQLKSFLTDCTKSDRRVSGDQHLSLTKANPQLGGLENVRIYICLVQQVPKREPKMATHNMRKKAMKRIKRKRTRKGNPEQEAAWENDKEVKAREERHREKEIKMKK